MGRLRISACAGRTEESEHQTNGNPSATDACEPKNTSSNTFPNGMDKPRPYKTKY